MSLPAVKRQRAFPGVVAIEEPHVLAGHNNINNNNNNSHNNSSGDGGDASRSVTLPQLPGNTKVTSNPSKGPSSSLRSSSKRAGGATLTTAASRSATATPSNANEGHAKADRLLPLPSASPSAVGRLPAVASSPALPSQRMPTPMLMELGALLPNDASADGLPFSTAAAASARPSDGDAASRRHADDTPATPPTFALHATPAPDAFAEGHAHDASAQLLADAPPSPSPQLVTTGRASALAARLKDLEPFSVEYVYERHRLRCRTTSPTPGSNPGSAQRSGRSTALSYFAPQPPQVELHLGELLPEEREAVQQRLLPKKVLDDAFDSEFDHRLKQTQRRNCDDALKAAQLFKKKMLRKFHDEGQHRVEHHEQRVQEIEAMIAHRQEAKRAAHLATVTQMWLHVVQAVRFSYVLMYCLQEQKSMETLRRTMLPMIIRKRDILHLRWARRDLTAARLEENPVPTPTMIRRMQGQFFQGWSDAELGALIRYAEPKSFRQNECIMFEGDYDRVMYFITRGTIEVQIRDKKRNEKRRRKEFAAASFPIPAPAYVGEFALLCKEPRSATIQCITDVDTWVVSSANFHSVVSHLSREIAQKQQDATDARRKANLRKYFSLRPEVIRKTKYFADWDTPVLREMSAALEPLVLRPNYRLYTEGDYEPALYFIADGKVRLTKPSEPSEPAVDCGPGEVIGAFETFFMQERRNHTAICLTNCDLWKLTRHQLLELGMSDPGALVRSKQVVQESKTSEMYRLPKAPPYVLHDPYLSSVLPPSAIQLMWSLGQPRVVGSGEYLTIEGDEVRHLIVIVLGSFQISHLDAEMKRFDDKMIVSPVLGGVHSGSQYSNDNLKHMFPACHYCDIPKAGGNTSLLKPKKSFRSGSVVAGSPLSGVAPSSSVRFTSAADMASSLRIAQEEGNVGVLLGGYEYASRQTRWSATYRCTSMCEMFVIDKELLESKLPPQLVQLHRSSMQQLRLLIDAFLARNPLSINALPPLQRIVGMYHALKVHEKQQEKNQQLEQRGGGGGGKLARGGLLRSVAS